MCFLNTELTALDSARWMISRVESNIFRKYGKKFSRGIGVLFPSSSTDSISFLELIEPS